MAGIPTTLKRFGKDAFDPWIQRVVCVQSSCNANAEHYEDLFLTIAVLPDASTMIGRALVWDLRELREVVIPNGAKTVGDYWFAGTNIESVEVPASV